MKKYMFFLFLFCCLLNIACSIEVCAASATAKVEVKVIDEEGVPVEGARVSLCFLGGCRPKEMIYGESDENGMFSKINSSPHGRIGIGAVKDGYYRSSAYHSYPPLNKKLGRWQPWSIQKIVVLRPIINPVPMYVRNKWISVPIRDKAVGFDLIKADWVAPYGQGIVADFIIKSEGIETKEEGDFKLTLTFSNENDGIKLIKKKRDIFDTGSWYQLPRTAPENGYTSKHIVQRYMGPKGIIARDENYNFIFRVRTEVDKNGKITKALYGKILGDFYFAPIEGSAGKFKMHYYLNPDGTRNLEYDPKRNLFSNLPIEEGLAQP